MLMDGRELNIRLHDADLSSRLRRSRVWVAILALVLVAACSDSGSGTPSSEAGSTAEPSAPAVVQIDGEKIYNRNCFSCHAAGLADAPKTGDAEAWAPRLAKGPEILLKSVKEGMPPGMPPMGLCSQCSDAEFMAAIEFMTQ